MPFVLLPKVAGADPVDKARFAWNEYEQNVVLGAYFWLHWLSQVPGGVLARRFGTKAVFAFGNGVPVLLTFLAPWAAQLGHRPLAALRLLQGLISVSERNIHFFKLIPPLFFRY